MEQKWIVWVVVALVAIGGWYALGSAPATGVGNENLATGEAALKVRAEAGRFVPEKVTARRGELVIIEFTAVDNAYDIGFEDPRIGFNIKAAPGETKVFGFETKDRAPGNYTFRCFDFCSGGPMTGTLTISG